ncbi:MAG: iron-sulfur cluster assembly scaffold protein [Deltaproteobacteria bacterium]|nr:iron-sulfur cluster assembly scaffold protein [Deltaproteobacteria bacterium]MBW2138481.1 iron-sulfur cluster assembly scaffold protein [Deltaproteobacteria bacterium]
MGDSIEDFVQELQNRITEEIKEAYGEIAYERWLNPPNRGALPAPDGHAVLRGVCGDTMEIFLQFENDRVSNASFQTDGCGASIVCGSFAAEMALGKSPDELLEITGESIMESLGKLPKNDAHCAFLAAETLHEALNDYMIKETRKSKPTPGDSTSNS